MYLIFVITAFEIDVLTELKFGVNIFSWGNLKSFSVKKLYEAIMVHINKAVLFYIFWTMQTNKVLLFRIAVDEKFIRRV